MDSMDHDAEGTRRGGGEGRSEDRRGRGGHSGIGGRSPGRGPRREGSFRRGQDRSESAEGGPRRSFGAGRGERRADARGGAGRRSGRFDDRGLSVSRRPDRERDREPQGQDERSRRPGLERKADEPPTPTEFDEKMLPRAVRAELRGLPKDLAAIVGAHLLMAGELIDEDPDLALAHAHAARRRAARLPIVREATAEAAYAAGDWQTALSEFRALQRMSGGGDYLPVMADCERALGKPREAIRLAKEAASHQLDPAMQLEMVIVEAGARADLGQVDEALRLLNQASTTRRGPKQAHARMLYTAADLYEQAGRTDEAIKRFQRVVELDEDELLDAPTRLARLGVSHSPDVDVDILAMVEDDEDEPTETTEFPKEQ